MEKPTPGELRNVDVRFISLVDKGANGRTFKIFKAADPVGAQEEVASSEQHAQAHDDQEMKGFFQTVKEFFAKRLGGKAAVEKADKPLDFAVAITAVEAEDQMWRAFSLARDVVVNILSGDTQDKEAAIAKVADDLKAYLTSKIKQIGVAKALEQCKSIEAIEKAGRKISAARLKALKDAHALLSQVIEEAELTDEGDGGKGDTQVTKEELKKAVSDMLEEAIKPVTERLEKLEKADQAPEQPEDAKDDFADVIKQAVAEAIGPIEQRLAVVEKARGISNKVPEDTVPIEKSGSFWGGVFIG